MRPPRPLALEAVGLPDADYLMRWIAVSERLVALAGYRLAGLLNVLAAERG